MAGSYPVYHADVFVWTDAADRLGANLDACTGPVGSNQLPNTSGVSWPSDYPINKVTYLDPSGVRLDQWWTAGGVLVAKEFVYAAYHYTSSGWAAVVNGVSYRGLEVDVWLLALKVWGNQNATVGTWSLDPLMGFNGPPYTADVGGGNAISFPVDPAAGTTNFPGFIPWNNSGGQAVAAIVPLR